jgi:phosphoinositide-3-kinase regulatory subunit alpha/beta/delta
MNDEEEYDGEDRLPHQNEMLWMIGVCSREEAERFLQPSKQLTGTFLVRPNSTGQFALSVVCNNRIYHCIINKTERGYGFADPYNIYKSLKALVLHYALNSLEVHNDNLTTALVIPVMTTDHAKKVLKNFYEKNA